VGVYLVWEKLWEEVAAFTGGGPVNLRTQGIAIGEDARISAQP
jgi:hypothetical protein